MNSKLKWTDVFESGGQKYSYSEIVLEIGVGGKLEEQFGIGETE